MPFNPNAPDSLGNEWFAPGVSSRTVDADSKAVMQVLEANASTSIDTVYTELNASGSGTFILEIFNAGSEIPANVTSAVYRPNEDVSRTVFVTQGGATTNLYQSIDTDPDLNFHIVGSTSALSAYKMRFGTAGVLTGKRILGVSFEVSLGTGGAASPAMTLQYSVDGTNNSPLYTIPAVSASVGTGQPNPLSSPTGVILTNVAEPTDRIWTIAHVQAMDSTGWVELRCPTPAGVAPYVWSVTMTVYYADENRLAWGYETPASPGLQTVTFSPLVTPAGASSFARTSGNEYSYLIRRVPSSSASDYIVAPLITSAPPLTSAAAYAPTLSYGYATTLGTALSGAFPLWLRNTSPAQTTDGQPYYSAEVAQSFTANDVEQEIDPTANDSYGLVRALVAPLTTGTIGDLTVNVRNRSGDTLMGTGTITRADWLDESVYTTIDGVGFRIVDIPLSSVVALSSAATYYLEFQCTATGGAVTGGTDAWGIAYLEGGQAESSYGSGSYGMTINGVESFTNSAIALLITQPDAPGSASLSAAAQTIPDIGGMCSDVNYAYTVVDWADTSLAADFDHYEVQRSIDGGTTWQLIAENLETESVSTFSDYEGPRNVSTQYRVRVVRIDGAPSEWVSAGSITPSDNGCTIAFVSNRDPSLNIAYMDTTPRQYEFLDADEVEIIPLFDRDYHVAFIPTELRGVKWEPTLTVYSAPSNGTINPPGGPGLGTFDALRDISNADLPYVCVLDSDGNQLFANVRVPQGRRQEPMAYYSAKVSIMQITDTPDTTP